MEFNLQAAKQLDNPSDDFNTFLDHHFITVIIGIRREQDFSVFQRLVGIERDVAKGLVMDNIETKFEWILWAAEQLKIDAAIPYLEKYTSRKNDDHLRYISARILKNWKGYKKYFKLLDEIMDGGCSFTKSEILGAAASYSPNDTKRLLMNGLRDSEDEVRSSALSGLLEITGELKHPVVDGRYYESLLYYTKPEIFADQVLFEFRLRELESRLDAALGLAGRP